MTATRFDKKFKTEVDYSFGMGDRRCGDCRFFQVHGPDECTKVYGYIAPQMWCNRFEKRDGQPHL